MIQYSGLRGLRVAVVHHLIQELVRDDEVVLDALLKSNPCVLASGHR